MTCDKCDDTGTVGILKPGTTNAYYFVPCECRKEGYNIKAKDHSTLIDRIWRAERDGYRQVGDATRIVNDNLIVGDYWIVRVEKVKGES